MRLILEINCYYFYRIYLYQARFDDMMLLCRSLALYKALGIGGGVRMEFLTDPVLLARIQFALTAMYHYVFVPLSIGLGLIVAVFETKYYRSRRSEDAAASRFWIKVFTATFALGVATGITMEFSFGTNWADYARFVGDIFGAPLAAEALLAVFLESVFFGVLLFGRKKVGHRF